MAWSDVKRIGATSYTCGHCGNKVASDRGYYDTQDNARRLYICPYCDTPSYMTPWVQVPGVAPGNEVKQLPTDIAALYKEARNSIAASAYTASVLTCRKLLMNIAVAQGADPGKPFIMYIEYLSANGYIPPNGKGWVDHIRKKGNEATHEIVLMSSEDAVDLILFTEMLLKFIYEFPSRITKPGP